MSFCGMSTPASKRYQRRVFVTVAFYVAVLFGAIVVVKHTHPHGWLLYAIRWCRRCRCWERWARWACTCRRRRTSTFG